MANIDEQWARECAERGAKEAFDAVSEWHRAKQDVSIALPAVDKWWPARFVRAGSGGYPVVAVTPAVNAEMIAAHSLWMDTQQLTARQKAGVLHSLRAKSARADGLVLFGESLAIVMSDPSDRAASSRANNVISARRQAQSDTQERARRRVQQRAREASVLADLPTETVDDFMVKELGYELQQVDGWAPSTRRPRRRAARGMIAALARGDVVAARRAGEQVSGADWRMRVDALMSRGIVSAT